MLWIIPAWVGSVIAVFFLGYYLQGLKKQLDKLTQAVKNSTVEPEPEEEAVSTLIDPTDPIQEAIYEHNKLMERLNGKDNQNS